LLEKCESDDFKKYCPPSNANSMYCIPAEPNEIYRIIVNLKNNKSPGADNIGSKILKEVVDDITCPLSHIFNLSFVKWNCSSLYEVGQSYTSL